MKSRTIEMNTKETVTHILVVEDEPAHAELICRCFERADRKYSVTVASTIKEAKQSVTQRNPDLALVDYNLPDGHGDLMINFGEGLFPMIMLTSHGDEQLAVQAIKSGALDYIAKSPESFDALPSIVEHVLREWHLIVERKKAEELLRASEERHRIILQTAMDGFWLIDINGRMLEVNRTYSQMSGYSIQELLTMEVNDLKLPEAAVETPSQLAKIVEKGQDRFESKHRRKDGSIFDVEISMQYRPNDGGQIVVFLRDISERKRSEAKVRQLTLAIQQASTSVMITDVNGTIEYVNEASVRTSGYSINELIGQKPSILKSDEMPHEHFDNLWRTIGSGKEWTGEFHNRRKDGTLYWESVVIAPVKDDSGKTINYIAVKDDITERKEMQTQLFRSQRMESIGTLAGGIAHDLNNILGPILLSVQILKRKVKDDALQNLIATIEASSLRGKDIISQVLGFARGADSKPVLMQMRHILNEVKNIIEQTFPRNIEIQCYAPKDLWTINADPTQIHQVLMNLCVNARDAMPHGGKLTVNAKNATMGPGTMLRHPEAIDDRYLVIEVRDSGAGIPQDIQQKIFDPFFTTKELGKGTGLGLSTVYSIVKQHLGFIQMDSVPGEGTSFLVYIPVSTEHIKPDLARPKENISYGNNELVLIVDDEHSIRMVCEETLRFYNYNVITANNGADGLAKFVESGMKTKVVLIDMMMPQMDGKTASTTIRRIDPFVKIIGMSGLMSETPGENDNKLFDYFLQKPFTGEALMDAVQTVMETVKTP
jgi:PAS domain S-box-containing protein